VKSLSALIITFWEKRNACTLKYNLSPSLHECAIVPEPLTKFYRVSKEESSVCVGDTVNKRRQTSDIIYIYEYIRQVALLA